MLATVTPEIESPGIRVDGYKIRTIVASHLNHTNGQIQEDRCTEWYRNLTYVGNFDGAARNTDSIRETKRRVPPNRAVLSESEIVPGTCAANNTANDNVV
ncbi:hypothetical protein RRF57_002429 [Xylaria bambusicola]|uniref:Uncharacterized protein n=1 Tax=Xylaria bambusicola TaxID=326684 RepID=A0AAN7UIZ9_9PEZI